ncbi:PA14 domain-containing protein [Actinocrispum wychmicini]|uniref:YD repeat-containing protein n=1 Tax=Actinocrispum wychmicini TaxID=1213861 RepID=A0A4R2K6W8_9PSEU|nr:PA14 domain-containing protein [Actinocrispum wychmicini]TCO62095.1 YD repeat-containing protein [Actinocrispum wychmicini]
MAGLQAAFYDNPFLSGVPAVWQTGVGTPDGSLSGSWGGTPPVPNTDGWSGRFTGEIQFPTTGQYGVGFTAVDGVRLRIDDVLTVDSWSDKPSTAVTGTYMNATAGSWHRVRVDYYNRAGTSGALSFTWTPPGASAAVTVPGQNLAPRYGYPTSTVTDSNAERAPSTTTTTNYSDPANGIDPALGLAVATTSDRNGLNLTRRNSFEKPGQGYLRRLATSLPAGDIANPDQRGTSTYYGDTETRTNPCDTRSPAVSQGGMPKTVAGGNPLATKVSDDSGSTTTVIDLLRQMVSYTDANGAVTVSQYDVANRKTSDTTRINGATSTLTYHWDTASRLTGQDLDGTTIATPAYDAGFLRTVAYGNNSNLAVTDNDAESLTALAWTTPGSTVTDTVTRARDKRVTDDTITDTTGPSYKSAYTHDGVGRLIAATVPHHQLTYAYAGDGGCGPNPKAGANTNRTASTDSLNGAPAVSTSYCYDNADRLVATNGGLALSFKYDTYGNATSVGTDTLGYDSTRRHVSTTTAAGRTVRYTRDVTDRITARTAQDNANSPVQVTRYGFTSDTGGPDFILDGSEKLQQRVLTLPGGVVQTDPVAAGSDNDYDYTSGDPVNYNDLSGAIPGVAVVMNQFPFRSARIIGARNRTAVTRPPPVGRSGQPIRTGIRRRTGFP